MPKLDGVEILDLSKTMEEIDKEFSSTEYLDEKVMYNFFKGEITPELAYSDNSSIQRKADKPKRKYVGGFWKVIPDQIKAPRPWVRIGISGGLVPSLELIVPKNCGKVPKMDLTVNALDGIGYGFKMGIEYTHRLPGLMVETVINTVAAEEYKELLNIANQFHEKLKSYRSIR